MMIEEMGVSVVGASRNLFLPLGISPGQEPGPSIRIRFRVAHVSSDFILLAS